MMFTMLKSQKLGVSTKAILGSLAVLFFTTGSSAWASSDNVRFSKQVQRFVANNECAKKAALEAASEAFGVISDLGVDWPDYIEVSEISSDFADENPTYRIISQSFGFSYKVLNATQCTLSSVSRLLTVQQPVKWRSPSMNMLHELGTEYLGQEFFGAANIGSAHTFVVDEYEYNTSTHSPTGIVQEYYKEWHHLDVEPVLETDRSKANVEKLLLDLLGVEAIDDETTRVSDLLTKNILASLEGNESFELVSGSWFGSGLGDPTAGFLAIVATRSGKVLILEQGFVD